jgi:pyrophosphate--fructose-6-phosphate 1-phosphotransferase
VPEGLIEFIPEVNVLIKEINEIVSMPFENSIRDHVQAHLTETSKSVFNFLPKAIQDQLLLDRDPHGNV